MLKVLIWFLIGALTHVTVTSKPASEKGKSPPSGIHILDGICIAKRTDRLVYRHRNDTHVYIAFDVLTKGRVLVYSWEIIRAANKTFISSMKEESLPAVDFRKTVNRQHILGATGKRHFKKFKNRLMRKMEECKAKRKKKKYCKIRSIINVIVRLTVRNVTFSETGECDV